MDQGLYKNNLNFDLADLRISLKNVWDCDFGDSSDFGEKLILNVNSCFYWL